MADDNNNLSALFGGNKGGGDASDKPATENPDTAKSDDSRAIEQGGTDQAFVGRGVGGQSGNDPATGDEIESAEQGSDQQSELNEASYEAQRQGAVRESAFTAGITDDTAETPQGKTWTSHPISNYALGNFQFENGTLTLTDPSEIERFETQLASPHLPARDKALIQEINVDRANKIAADFLKQRGTKRTGVDHSDSTPQA